jgi:hypothetical protein
VRSAYARAKIKHQEGGNRESSNFFVFIAILGNQYASATVTTFTDRAFWEAEIGGSPDYLVDFNEMSVDTFFLDTPFDAGPFSLTANMEGEDYIDTAPFHPNFAIDGTPHVHASLGPAGSGELVEMDMEVGVWAWGADFSEIDYGGMEMVLTTDVGTETISGPDQNGFFGLIMSSSETLLKIEFVGLGTGEDFGMDNVALPEPTTLSLLTLGCMPLLRRRRTS